MNKNQRWRRRRRPKDYQHYLLYCWLTQPESRTHRLKLERERRVRSESSDKFIVEHRPCTQVVAFMTWHFSASNKSSRWTDFSITTITTPLQAFLPSHPPWLHLFVFRAGGGARVCVGAFDSLYLQNTDLITTSTLHCVVRCLLLKLINWLLHNNSYVKVMIFLIIKIFGISSRPLYVNWMGNIHAEYLMLQKYTTVIPQKPIAFEPVMFTTRSRWTLNPSKPDSNLILKYRKDRQ